VFLALAGFLSVALTGCTLNTTAAPTPDAGLAITGSVHGGQSPIVGAHVYLLAANAGVFTPNASGYGNASLSLLKNVVGQTTLDSSGGPTNGDYYVTTDSSGNFAITGDYTCLGGQQVYMYSLGGDPGLGSGSNAASGLLASLGTCPGSIGVNQIFSSGLFVVINEVSTVAAAYSFAGFATDATHVSSSGTAAAKLGIANAFINAAILETLGTGVANAAPPPGVGYFGGGGSVPQTTVNTLGNILAACVNSTGPASASCTTLFSNAESGGTTGTAPTETATAAINIAHNPVATVSALFALSSAYAQFAPTLTAQPNDFTLAIYFNAGTQGSGPMVADGSGNIWYSDTVVDVVNHEGYDPTPPTGFGGNNGYAVPYYPHAIALDVSGNLWSVNGNDGGPAPSLNEITAAGATGAGSPFTTLGITNPTGLAADASSNLWIANSSPGAVIKATSAGALSGTFSTGGISSPQAIAIDPSGNAWIADGANSVIKLSSTGSPLSGTSGYTGIGLNSPTAIALDHTGNVWVTNKSGNNVVVISSTGGAVSGSAGYTPASLSQPSAIAIDGSGNAWVKGLGVGQDAGNYTITELSNSGAVLSGANGYFSTSPGGIAIDASGDVWTNYAHVTGLFTPTWYVEELVGAATPVVGPLSVGVTNNTLGTRP
jgi:streptogramin lyase